MAFQNLFVFHFIILCNQLGGFHFSIIYLLLRVLHLAFSIKGFALYTGLRKLLHKSMLNFFCKEELVFKLRAMNDELKFSFWPIFWSKKFLVLFQALDTFNTAVVSPIYYVMFTSLTILASVIMFKVLLFYHSLTLLIERQTNQWSPRFNNDSWSGCVSWPQPLSTNKISKVLPPDGFYFIFCHARHITYNQFDYMLNVMKFLIW